MINPCYFENYMILDLKTDIFVLINKLFKFYFKFTCICCYLPFTLLYIIVLLVLAAGM